MLFLIGLIFVVFTVIGVLVLTVGTVGSGVESLVRKKARKKARELLSQKYASEKEINRVIDQLLLFKPVTEEDRDLIQMLREMKERMRQKGL